MPKSKLINSYIENMTKYLLLTTDLDETSIESKLKEIINTNYKQDSVYVMATDKNQSVNEERWDLLTFTERNCFGNIIAPSGSIYSPAQKQASFTSKFISKNIEDRNTFKKEMFNAIRSKDNLKEDMYYCLQTIKKIINNAMSGACLSKYGIFYDAGNYNSITSLGRSLIIHAFTTAESVLGDNFALYNEEMCITHIISCLNNINKEQTKKVMNKYKLRHPSKDEVFNKFIKIVNYYEAETTLDKVKTIINKLDDIELAYLFYYNSLKSIMMENSDRFKKYIKLCMDTTSIEIKEYDLKELKTIDSNLASFITLAFGDEFPKKMNLATIDKDNPKTAMKFISYAKTIKERLEIINDLFDTFLYSDMMVGGVWDQNNMARDIVPFSDTDSITAQLSHWAEWYTGESVKTVSESYQISAIHIYWFTIIIEKLLAKFSIHHGMVGEMSEVIQMKNEFLYVCQLLYAVKKNYAGIIAMQEGILLEDMKVDIKGSQLRSSDINESTTKFIENFIVNDILKKSITEKLEAETLIHKIIDFEHKIKNSLKNGEIEFLIRISVGLHDRYKKPLSSPYLYYLAWDEIFAEKYGEVSPPFKSYKVQLVPPTNIYLDELYKTNKKIHRKFLNFKDKYGKYPSYIVLPPSLQFIPTELIPLISVKDIVYHNVRMLHMTLERFNIYIGYSKKKLLLSDIY